MMRKEDEDEKAKLMMEKLNIKDGKLTEVQNFTFWNTRK
jgi:hypothetical protein